MRTVLALPIGKKKKERKEKKRGGKGVRGASQPAAAN